MKSLSGLLENLAQRQALATGTENRLGAVRLGPQLSFGATARKKSASAKGTEAGGGFRS